MRLKIAVVSDLHCHLSTQGRAASYLICDKLADPLVDNPVNSLLEMMSSESLTADILILPGDFANQICPEGVKAGWVLCKELARKLGAEAMATLGNHDVDYKDISKDNPFVMVKNLGLDFPTNNPDSNNSFWEKGYAILLGDNWKVLILNTTHFYFNPECTGQGDVTHRQLILIEKELQSTPDKEFQIVLAHHPPIIHDRDGSTTTDVIHLADDLLVMIENNGFSFFIHGHKHDARLSYGPHSVSSPAIFSAASLSCITKQHDKLNGFHIITLSDDHIRGCRNQGWIETWTYLPNNKWQKEYNKSFPPQAGFGFRGVIDELEEKLYAYLLGKPRKSAPWSEILAEHPEISFMLPQDLNRLIKLCKRKHNIETDVLVDKLYMIKMLSIIS